MLISIHRILCPTDFSESAQAAQQYAIALADRFSAELHLMHVVPPPMPYPDAASPFVVPEADMKAQLLEAEERLQREVQSPWLDDHRPKYIAVTGFAVDEILKYATEQEIDLIVVGTHGHTGLSRLLIGSVAEKLVRMASCPVLTTHAKGHQFLVETVESEQQIQSLA